MVTRCARAAIVSFMLTSTLALTFCARPAEQKASEGAQPSPADVPQAAAPEAALKPQAQTAAAPSPPPSVEPEFAPERAAGAVKGIPSPKNTAPIVAVANYFTELPGIDLASLQPRQKEKLLQRVNSELCTCGCRNDTLARCYVNDPRCPVVKGMVQRVYDDVRSGR